MNDNRKSFKFVGGSLANTAKNILSSTQFTMFPTNHHLAENQEVYDPELRQYTNYDEKFKSNLNATENITNHSTVQSVSTKISGFIYIAPLEDSSGKFERI